MNELHIASAFDRDLEALQALIMKMGGMTEEAILEAARSLETRDEKLAENVRLRDRAIDGLDEQVHEEAARILALRQPTAGDLRTVLTVMKISSSLERVGDYAKNMAKRTSVLAQMSPIGGTPGAIRRMAKTVEVMLKDVLDAYIQRDQDLAADVRQRDAEVDHARDALEQSELLVELDQLVGGAAAIAFGLGLLHIGIVELALQPAGRTGGAFLRRADPRIAILART